MGIIALGAGHSHLHPHLQAAHDEGVGHVVAVADVAHLQTLQHRLVLPDRHQVGQHLAGVAEIRQAVDHRDVGVGRQGLHLLLGKGADHNAVTVPQQHPGGVLHRLAPADLALLAGEEQGVAAQLVHPGLKGDAGAGGIFLEDHGQSLALQLIVGDAVFLAEFQLVRGIQDLQNILFRQVKQLQQVFFHLRSPFSLDSPQWVSMVPMPSSDSSSNRMAWGTLPSSRVADRTPERTASTLQFAFSAISGGITPLRIMAGTWDSPSSGMGASGAAGSRRSLVLSTRWISFSAFSATASRAAVRLALTLYTVSPPSAPWATAATTGV